MAVRLLLLVATCSWVVVSGELCQFPSDHPIQDLESGVAVPVQQMENNHVYIYTDQFGSCHGCVRSLRFCYGPISDELMTIEIGTSGGGLSASHVVTVDSTNDRTNCAETYSLNHFYCCVEQILTEPFVVGNQNWHYWLRFGNVASLLLRHLNETVAGRQEDVHGTTTVPVYKPLFYFTIHPGDEDCSNVPSTTPSSTTPAATASESTTESTTETADATVSTTESTTETVDTTESTTESTTGGDTTTMSEMPVQSETLTGSNVMPSSPAIPTERSSGTTFSIVVGVSVPLVVLTITAFIIIISVTVCVRRRKRRRAAAENIALCSIGSQLKPTNENSPEEYDYVSAHQPHPLQPRLTTTDTDSARRDVLTTSNQAYGVTQGGDGVTENVAYGVGQNDFTCDTGADAGEEEGEKYDYVTRDDVIVTAARNEAYGVTGDVSLTSYGLVA